MKLPTWMHRKGGGKRQRRKKAQENEQASVAADGTVAAPPQAQIQQRPSLQRPTSGEIYYDAQETLSDFGDADEPGTGFPIPNLLRRLSSANRAPSKSRRPPPDVDLPMVLDANGNQVVEVEPGVTAPRDAVMAAEGPMSAPGCLSLFNSAGVTSKRFVRTSKPIAGASLTRQESGAAHSGSWGEPDATTFMVRGSDYMKTRRKVNSDKAIYRLVNVDIYTFDFKLNHIAKHLKLPAAPRLGPAALDMPQEERLPPVLVVNVQLPAYPASLFGAQDGQGLSLVYYFTLPEGWEPKDVGSEAALGMLQRFIHDGREQDNTKTRDRLKLIPRVSNLDEWAQESQLSGAEQRLLHKYNDKPLLTKPQHHFYSGPDYFEIDLDVHAYAYLARKAFASYLPRLGSVVFENALVIQGNRPEELPEVVLGAARVYRTDFTEPRPFPARLTRTTSDMPDTPV
ncbi:TPA: hypothetical protein ACH3X3_013326 [Trebouxia sp. C0006]